MKPHATKTSPRTAGAIALLALCGASALGVMMTNTEAAIASSHSDAPLIKQDPQANLTDVYAFVGTKYDDPSVEVLNVIANVRPLSEPGDGPHYDRFDSHARYSLHITNPSTGETLIRYDFQFSDYDDDLKNPNTILSYGLGTEAGPIMEIGDAQQNFTQFYGVNRFSGNAPSTPIARDVLAGIPNPGSSVTPLYNDGDGLAVSGAGDFTELDAYTQQAIFETGTGEVLFAGPREDGFYADIAGVFDLLDVRILDNNGTLDDGLGQDGGGVDLFKGFNVLTYGIQIPLDQLPASTYQDAFFGEQTGVGVYASVSRRTITKRNSNGSMRTSGPFVQVNRLGNPLFNETLVALADKDRYNVTTPDADAQFATYASNPELAGLINFVYGTNFQATERVDLEAVFIPDVIRVATTTGPVTLSGETGFSRLGFIGGDTTDGISSGWPNGRRFGDDVVDIALTAIASGPTYDSITLVGDNVAMNDAEYHRVFPYAATPHAGKNVSQDSEGGENAPTGGIDVDLNGDGRVDHTDVTIFIREFGKQSGG